MLGVELAPHLIKGVQENGILATMKHYINNNIENDRRGVSADIDERTEAEIYLPPAVSDSRRVSAIPRLLDSTGRTRGSCRVMRGACAVHPKWFAVALVRRRRLLESRS